MMLLYSTSVVSQRLYDMKSSYGRLIEYKGNLKKADIVIDYRQHWVIIDKVTYNIISYTHTEDKQNDYFTFHTITNGSVKYDIVWDRKHRNLLITKVKINKP